MAGAKFVVKIDNGGEYRWNLVSTANGQTICTSGEGFTTKGSCMDNIQRVKDYSADAEVEDKTEE